MKINIQLLTPFIEECFAEHGTFHDGDAGLDLFIAEDTVVLPGEMKLLPLGIKAEAVTKRLVEANNSIGHTVAELPTAYTLMPRSSICKTPLRMANSIGLIDAGYRGEIKCPVDNISQKAFTAKAGTRLCQLAAPDLSPIHMTIVEEVSESSRGEGGFGSTGK